MAVELITGTPGAGKTTYAVSRRIAREVGRLLPLPDETCIKAGLDLGATVARRIVVAGIRGLVIDHERLPHVLTRDQPTEREVDEYQLMDPLSPERPKYQRLPGDPPVDVAPLVQNWWLWCKPGDLIVVDEVQFLAPRGTLGRKPPYWIQALEIHRHYGVDFLFITQHPQLVDTVIRALVGQHSHVRSVMGSSLCMVYTWDHASNPERYQLASKAPWRRGPSDYRLFHSAAAHVKPPASGRSALVVIPALLVCAGFAFVQFKARFDPLPPGLASAPGPGASSPRLSASSPGLSASGVPVPFPSPVPAPGAPGGPPASVLVSGCFSYRAVCQCYRSDGSRLALPFGVCQASALDGFASLVKWEPSRPPPSLSYGAAAGSVGGSLPASSGALAPFPLSPSAFSSGPSTPPLYRAPLGPALQSK
jgi:zona occludens toxin